MKRAILLPMIFFLANAFGQEQLFPNGIYLTLDQLRKQTPSFQSNISATHRTSSDIFMNGGNDYWIESNIDSLNAKYFKNKIYACVKNDSLFLNCNKLALFEWYSLCLTKGIYLAFRAMPQGVTSDYSYLMGGIISGVASGIQAKKRILYVLNLHTGKVSLLTSDFLSARLKDKQKLTDDFYAEKNKESDTVLLKYIALLNNELPLSSLDHPLENKAAIDTSVLLPDKNFPPGVYLTLEQLKNYKPAYQADFRVTLRSSVGKMLTEGNEYKVEPGSNSDNVRKKDIKKNIFAFVKNDSVFINGDQIEMQSFYALSATHGNYLVFHASPHSDDPNWFPGSRFLYILSLSPFSLRELNMEYMFTMLKGSPALFDQFNAEEDQSSEAILIKYVNLLSRFPRQH